MSILKSSESPSETLRERRKPPLRLFATTGYAYASGQGFHVKLTPMQHVVPLPTKFLIWSVLIKEGSESPS
ncbi:MAG: hypothetical protein RMY34_12555 [Aulosira sp. DedQUE10]|nr:hypothetical protein [Aulosira sp. DedQUE10]